MLHNIIKFYFVQFKKNSWLVSFLIAYILLPLWRMCGVEVVLIHLHFDKIEGWHYLRPTPSVNTNID